MPMYSIQVDTFVRQLTLLEFGREFLAGVTLRGLEAKVLDGPSKS